MRRSVVGSGLCAVALVATSAFLPACEKHHKAIAPEPVATVIADSLVFARADATVLEMGATPLVCCGLYDPGFVNERAMRVVFYDPANQKPGWQILILVDHAQAGATVTLPTVTVPPSKVASVSMFATDFGNEWSSDTEESAGTITVHSFSCDAASIRIRFSVDATLGSEFGGSPSLGVRGTFEATFPARSCT